MSTGKACSLVPRVGQDTFAKLKREFGYETAYTIFQKITGNDFAKYFGNSVTLDSDGVPTYESIMKLPIIRKFIGQEKLLERLNRNQPVAENTLSNVRTLITKAQEFNNNSDYSNDFVAIVDDSEEQTIRVQIVPRTKENEQIAINQYKIQKLNEVASSMLSAAGISIDLLSRMESAAGRVGVTEFIRHFNRLQEFGILMRVANNMEGFGAISEEFAHIIIGVYNDQPLVQRGINYFKNERAARQVLGDDFDKVYEFYNGNMDMVAEEAAGHVFRDILIDKIDKINSNKPSLFKRMFNSIISMFKGINPGHYSDTLNSIRYDYGKFADDILNGKQKLRQETIQKAKRQATLNALAKKAKVQIDVLKKASITQSKGAMLQRSTKPSMSLRGSQLSAASNIDSIVEKAEQSGETVKAVAETLNLLHGSVQETLQKLSNLEKLPFRERFQALRDALTDHTVYSKILDDMDLILSEEYLNDESIANQRYLVEDANNSLEDYQVAEKEAPVDTSKLDSAGKIERMAKDSAEWDLSADKSHYENGNRKGFRVTKAIQDTEGGVTFDENSPYYTPSTNIGTGVDEFVRDFFMGKIINKGGKWQVNGKTLSSVYPNASEEQLQNFAKQLQRKKNFFKRRGITIVPRDIKAIGTIDTVDGNGRVHHITVVGTLDLIGYDKNGDFHIFDMKTHRSEITAEHKEKWTKQLSLYKKLLEERYGIKVVETSIIPIQVDYPAPYGTKLGTTKYEVSTNEKPKDYDGVENNQLMVDGEEYRNANPFLEPNIPLKSKELEIQYSKIADDPSNGAADRVGAMLQAVSDSRRLLDEIKKIYRTAIAPTFVRFLKDWLGKDTITVADPDHKGKFKTVSLEKLIQNMDIDLTWAQRFLCTMSDTPDTFLQLYDKIIKNKKHEKRAKSIEASQKITALGIKYEKLGITDYSFMFEEGKQRYINKEYNLTAYNKALQDFEKKLDEKYGKVLIGSDEYKNKEAERLKWIKNNTKIRRFIGTLQTIPDPKLYPSTFDSLSDAQKNLYNEWMDIKEDLDLLLDGKTTLTNSIKIRKSNIERLRNLSPKEIVNKLQETFKKSYDDETSYAKGIRDVNGNETMALPVLYIKTGNMSGEDISTDIISTLIAYADMAYNYDAMNSVVDALEIGREVVLDTRKIGKRALDHRTMKRVKERFTPGKKEIIEDVTINTRDSEFAAALYNLLRTKLYGITQQDSGEFLGGDINKEVDLVTKIGSYIQLGFNAFAQIANVLTGIAVTNVEAMAKEYFTASDLKKADQIYFSQLGSAMGDIGSRVQFSKLSLMWDKFNFKMDFEKNIRNKNFTNRNFFTRFFGPSIAFIGQDAGDHWLYSRAAIAHLNSIKLKLGNEEISVWDAYKEVPIDENVPEAGNKLVLIDGVTKLDGSAFTQKDVNEISGEIASMNKNLFGVYNLEDRIELRNYPIGRLLMQYRDWMPRLYRHRFGKATTDLEGNRERVEGFYRTTNRFCIHLIKDLMKGQFHVMRDYHNLQEYEQANIRRAITETSQFLAVFALSILLKSKDKDRIWALRALSYMATRMKTEIGAMNHLGVFSEGKKLMKSPFAATSVIDNISGLIGLLWPPNYFDEIERGDYKGHSSAYRDFMKSPFSLWYNTIKRHIKPERAENYYDD